MQPHQKERHPYHWYLSPTDWVAPGEQQAHDAASIRAWLALRHATTPETWAGLIIGHHLTPDAVE